MSAGGLAHIVGETAAGALAVQKLVFAVRQGTASELDVEAFLRSMRTASDARIVGAARELLKALGRPQG